MKLGAIQQGTGVKLHTKINIINLVILPLSLLLFGMLIKYIGDFMAIFFFIFVLYIAIVFSKLKCPNCKTRIGYKNKKALLPSIWAPSKCRDCGEKF